MALYNIDTSDFVMPKAINQEEHKFIDGDTLMNEEGNLLRIQDRVSLLLELLVV